MHRNHSNTYQPTCPCAFYLYGVLTPYPVNMCVCVHIVGFFQLCNARFMFNDRLREMELSQFSRNCQLNLYFSYDRTLMQSVTQPTEAAVTATTGAISDAGTKTKNMFGYFFGGKNAAPPPPPPSATGSSTQDTPPTTKSDEPPP